MKLLIQRVKKASVEVNSQVVGSIGKGVVVFVGITHSDTQAEVSWLMNKLIHLRLFADSEGKTNRSLMEEQGAALVISQFTLYADCNEGRRPSFTQAAKPESARLLYENFIEKLREHKIAVSTGIFGAEMAVSLINDGPFTLILERHHHAPTIC